MRQECEDRICHDLIRLVGMSPRQWPAPLSALRVMPVTATNRKLSLELDGVDFVGTVIIAEKELTYSPPTCWAFWVALIVQ